MRSVMTLLIVLACCLPAIAQETTPWGTVRDQPTVTTGETTPAVTTAAPLKLSVEEARARKGFSRKEKRTLRKGGFGRLYAWRTLREMKKEGDLVDADGKRLSNRVIATLITERWMDENPEAVLVCAAQYAKRLETSGLARDYESFFEALIKFLEDFLPLLIKLIGIFGGI